MGIANKTVKVTKMGLQDGGMLFLFCYISVLGLLMVTGDLNRDIPTMSNSLACTPDFVNAGQYVDSEIGSANCFDVNSDSSFSISGSESGQTNFATALISVIPGGRQVTAITSTIWGMLDAVLLKGWYHIIQAIIGDSPLTPFNFYFYLMLQMITDLWILYFFLIILGIVKGGVSVKNL